MHGYETKQLQKAYLAGLAHEQETAEARLAHVQAELDAGAEGPHKAYLERVAENATARVAAVKGELKDFASAAKTKRAKASKR